jgi:hypothetical protein
MGMPAKFAAKTEIIVISQRLTCQLRVDQKKLLEQEPLTSAKLRSTFPSWFVDCKPRRSRRSVLSKIDPQCSIVLLDLLVYIEVCTLVRGHTQSSLASCSSCSTLFITSQVPSSLVPPRVPSYAGKLFHRDPDRTS